MADRSNAGADPGPKLAWYQGVTRYQWWVFVVGAMAWLFDCADSRMFSLARAPALADLLGVPQVDPLVELYGNYATAAMMAGWAVGGLFFGVVGDRWGRVRTLSSAVLVYSACTGLSGLAVHWYDFCFYRFVMGAGIGGAFAASATLIAETLPSHARTFSMGLFSALSLFGNILGLVLAGWVFPADQRLLAGVFGDQGVAGWRVVFFAGALPALLVVLIMQTLRESEKWQEARRTARENLGRQLGDIRSMLAHPRWRRHSLVAVGLATAGIVGVWGVAFFSPELINDALTPPALRGQELPPELKAHIGHVKTLASVLQDLAGFLGILTFTVLAARYGRRPTFAAAFIGSFLTIVLVFLTLQSEWQAYVMLPAMGFATISVMGGFVIYFPEIYPTRFRSTGTALGYNLARLSAAAVMLMGNSIRDGLRHLEVANPFRVGAAVLACVYLLGLIALIWAPETKDQPLPEE